MTVRSLVSLDEYKEYSGINSTEYDDILTSIINKASAFIKEYCSRALIDNYDKATSTYTPIVEYTNDYGYYYTKEFPVRSVVSVEYSADNGVTYTPFTAIIHDKSKDAIFIGGTLEGINAYKVTYTGGYDKTPEDLKLACFDLVDFYYKKEAVPRKTSMNNTVEYVTSSNLPSHIKRVLDLYRVLM